MRSVLVHEFGGPDVLRVHTMPEPEPGDLQIQVRLHAAGVNPFDTYMRTGTYAIRPELPYIPGADGAGVVTRVGSHVTQVTPGARVFIAGTATHRAYGAYSEVVLCMPDQVHALPDHLTFAQGAAVNVPYVTAWRALHERAEIQPGEIVFIHGASGSVGLAATQIARAWGLTVIGSASTDAGRQLVLDQGATHVVNHREAGYLDAIDTLTGGRGPDVIIENLANVNLDHDLSIVAKYGRIVVVGNRGRIEIDPRKAMGKESAILGLALWNAQPIALSRAYHGIAAGLASRTLSPVVGTELPLSEAARAHQLVLEPGARGKIVLRMD